MTFWDHVSEGSDPEVCWRWIGSKTPDGYGKTSVRGRWFLAHRMAYELLVGPIPDGLEMDHLCRVRDCINPAHLEPVTHRENYMRGELGVIARKTACVNGHEFTPENTRETRVGDGVRRRCRKCQAEATKRYRERRNTR